MAVMAVMKRAEVAASMEAGVAVVTGGADPQVVAAERTEPGMVVAVRVLQAKPKLKVVHSARQVEDGDQAAVEEKASAAHLAAAGLAAMARAGAARAAVARVAAMAVAAMVPMAVVPMAVVPMAVVPMAVVPMVVVETAAAMVAAQAAPKAVARAR